MKNLESKQHGKGYLVDAHVHFHECFNPDKFFEYAHSNFQKYLYSLKLDSDISGFLLFTEGAGAHFFEKFKNISEQNHDRTWAFKATKEDCSLVASNGSKKIILVSGRQIVTKENLEVLAIGSNRQFPDNRCIEETIRNVIASGALPIIPWGFGKWIFRRGTLITEILNSNSFKSLFLGDNGGRLRFSKQPPHFTLARSKGILILPGSDPLPFPDQISKPGSYSFLIEKEPDLERPAQQLKDHLLNRTDQPSIYGQLESFYGFIKSQFSIQIKKQLKKLRK